MTLLPGYRRRPFSGISAIILGLLVFSFALSATAETLNIIVVKASKEGSGIDASLGPFKKQLIELGYRSATVVRTKSITVKTGEGNKISIAGNISAKITPTSIGDAFIKFDFKMYEGNKEVMKVGYRIPKGSHTIIVGPKAKNKKYILIIKASR